ncbi:MAG: peptidoglycan DD-metalloendopeptidase family protein [Acidimicrobiia bacterium]|nr:peptidoglycan DD-metalloendopeptidase family protein [Acidimicrobiia bacterium]
MSRRAIAVLVVIGALFVAPSTLANTPQEELEQVEAEIKSLNAQIAEGRERESEVATALREAEVRLSSLNQDLVTAQGRLDAAEARVGAGEAELTRIESILAQVARDLAETRLSIVEQAEEVRLRAAEMYMNQSFGLSGVLMEMDTVATAAIGWEYAGSAVADAEALVRDLEALQVQEEIQRVALEEQQAAQEQVITDLEGDRALADTERRLVEQAVSSATEEAAAFTALLEQVKSDIGQLEGEINSLEADSKRLEREIIALQTYPGERPSALINPVDGILTSAFGYRTHPISGVRKLHTGVDYGAGSGTPIYAANRGRVIYSGWYGGYGNTIIIDHGGGLTTLYAHQSRLRVSSGQEVALGDRIGDVGTTGYSTGPHLHFETRENGIPVDPRKYLG